MPPSLQVSGTTSFASPGFSSILVRVGADTARDDSARAACRPRAGPTARRRRGLSRAEQAHRQLRADSSPARYFSRSARTRSPPRVLMSSESTSVTTRTMPALPSRSLDGAAPELALTSRCSRRCGGVAVSDGSSGKRVRGRRVLRRCRLRLRVAATRRRPAARSRAATSCSSATARAPVRPRRIRVGYPCDAGFIEEGGGTGS